MDQVRAQLDLNKYVNATSKFSERLVKTLNFNCNKKLTLGTAALV